MLRDVQSEYEIIKSKLEEFKKEYPLVESSIELKKELDETKERCKQYEQIINGLERKLSEADQYNTRLEGANVDKDSKLKTAMHQLSVCQERLEQKKEEVNDDGSYYRNYEKNVTGRSLLK
jgi:predicted  nucleic acid-binding Zn-ribbon protein